MPSSVPQDHERAPLLQSNSSVYPDNQDDQEEEQSLDFDDDDQTNPRNWSRGWKYFQTLQIYILAFICPMASSIFAPAVEELVSNFHSDKRIVMLSQTGFVCMLGIGPLLLAPMSETIGRRPIFVTNLALFTLIQIPTALARNVESFVVLRTISGFFGSVGVANGGGSISDMFEKHERAMVLGAYFTAPLLAPTVGGLVGGMTIGSFGWRWIAWLVMVLSGLITVLAFFFLHESNAVVILQHRKKELQKRHPRTKYKVEGAGDDSVLKRIAQNSSRAVRILTTQPMVMIMSSYQALVFASMYSLYAQYSEIWSSPPYDFTKTQVGLAYIGPALGFITTAVVMVAFIDKTYTALARRNNDDGQPEYRLPLANIGTVLLPISIFWFGWTLEKRLHWLIPLTSTILFGASQVSIFNSVQTYYIDSFEQNAASALAAGAFLRSMVGGIVPLFVGTMFDRLGYGWGMSVFGILSLILMPAPLLFQMYGKKLRSKFPFKG